MKAIVVGLSGVYIVVLSIVLLVEKIPVNFLAVTMNQYKPSYSSADLSVTHQNRPIMHQGAR